MSISSIKPKYHHGDFVKINDGHIIVDHNGEIGRVRGSGEVIEVDSPDYPNGYVVIYQVMVSENGNRHSLNIPEECLVISEKEK